MIAGWSQKLMSNVADHTTRDTFTTDVSLLAGQNQLPALWVPVIDGPISRGKVLLFRAAGIVGSTATPTYTFTLRAGTTDGSAYLSGTTLAQSAAITTASGVTAKWWEMNVFIFIRTPGRGSTNCTVSVDGSVRSPGGFAAPYEYAMTAAGGDSQATWTTTIDGGVNQFLNLSVACSSSSGSNAITCKQLLLLAID